MPPTLPPSIAAGQSIAPTQFNQIGARNISPRATGYQNPDDVISRIYRKNGSPPILSYPTDLPKYHFTIVENEWHYFSYTLTSEKFYKIPFPRELQDKSEVNYEYNFNYLAQLDRLTQGVITAPMSAAAGTLGGIFGLKVTGFKSVTLDVPDFKTHQLSWTFAPKTFQESQAIQRIIFSLKKGMAPRPRFTGGGLVLQFPKVYTLYFSPNAHWLFKFKPCVLSTLVVDYAGGNPFGSFFSGDENPPESVTIATNWVELEFWLDSSYRESGPGSNLPSRDPLSDMDWYSYNPDAVSTWREWLQQIQKQAQDDGRIITGGMGDPNNQQQ